MIELFVLAVGALLAAAFLIVGVQLACIGLVIVGLASQSALHRLIQCAKIDNALGRLKGALS